MCFLPGGHGFPTSRAYTAAFSARYALLEKVMGRRKMFPGHARGLLTGLAKGRQSYGSSRIAALNHEFI
jgi:hypothetical protein